MNNTHDAIKAILEGQNQAHVINNLLTLSESDARLRQLEREWGAEDTPDTMRAYITAVVRSLEPNKRVFIDRPNAHAMIHYDPDQGRYTWKVAATRGGLDKGRELDWSNAVNKIVSTWYGQ